MRRAVAVGLILAGYVAAEVVAAALADALYDGAAGRLAERMRPARTTLRRPTPTEVHDVVSAARQITVEAARAADERG